MSKEVFFNDFLVRPEEFSLETIISEPTGNQVRRVKLMAPVMGDEQRRELGEIIKSTAYTVTFPEEEVSFKAKTVNSTWSYSAHTILTNTTPIDYTIELIELDKDLPQEHNMMGELCSAVIMNWIRTRAISQLLIDKGIITNQEYDQKLSELVERDFDNLKNLLAYGIPEPEEK